MANYTLGLDLGPTSIGWAILDEPNQTLIDAGVRVFPKGSQRDQRGAEPSKNEQRRIARETRRQISRRARRKKMLRRALVEAGLLPECALRPANDSERVAWERDQFRNADPYALRSRALKQRLEPQEIGRVLLHLNQRRGFLSNRKADRRQQDDSAFLKQISSLAVEMEDRTLGEHLSASLSNDPHVRVRGKHIRREMLIAEFAAIWDIQQKYHPTLLTDDVRYGRAGKQTFPRKPMAIRRDANPLQEFGLFGILFFQRSAYWQKGSVGWCELEPRKRHCPRADRIAQWCRLLQTVNNLRLIDSRSESRALTPAERKRLLAYLATARERTFDEIRKRLGLSATCGFNLEVDDRQKLLGMPTDKSLSHQDLFGPRWYSLPDDEKNAIVRSLIFEDEQVVCAKAVSEWGLARQQTELLLNVDLERGYARLSREAIEKLTPFLEQGLPLMSLDGTALALEKAGYLRPDQRVVKQRDLLPRPPQVTNPLVREALYELRKVVNAIIREYGKPTAIHIELAREVKGTAELRRRQSLEIWERAQRRDQAAQVIRELGAQVTQAGIEKVLLWMEQGERCIYSGRPISPDQLLGGDVAIDHILPYSQSLDNSLANKIVCFRDENDSKGQRTPYAWLAETNAEKYAAILQRVAELPCRIRNRKRQKFSQQTVERDGVINRQLVDTAYITSQVAKYVRCLGAETVCSKGQLTAELRRQWGLDAILRDDGLHIKNREDHRHHAVDAVVIALTNRSRLCQLAQVRGSDRRLQEPWPDFRAQIARRINDIVVSHKSRRAIGGALHEQTLYGPTSHASPKAEHDRPWARGWVEEEGAFVYRKPLEALTQSMVDDIRDPDVRRVIVERLAAHGLKPGGRGPIAKRVWKDPLYLTRKPGRKTSHPSIIKKVRLIKRDSSIRPIRGVHTYVKPGSLHHACIFEIAGANGKVRRDAVYVSMLEARQRVRQRQAVVQRVHPEFPGGKFIMSLARGDMLLAEFLGRQRPVVVTTLVSTRNRIHFADANDARAFAAKSTMAKTPSGLRARKITVDLLGRIRWAND